MRPQLEMRMYNHGMQVLVLLPEEIDQIIFLDPVARLVRPIVAIIHAQGRTTLEEVQRGGIF
jgi:hypothetical protein